MGDWEDNGFSQFLDLFVQTTNISVLFARLLIDLHGLDSAVILVGEFLEENVSVLIHSYKLSRF